MLNRFQRVLLIIGTAAAMLAVMLLNGSARQMAGQREATRQAMRRLGGNTVVYNAREAHAENTVSYSSISPGLYAEIAKALDGEMLYAPITNSMGPISITAPGGTALDAGEGNTLLGTSEAYSLVVGAQLVAGRFLTARDVHEAGTVCVVSEGFLSYNGLSFSPGMRLQLGAASLSVVGVISLPSENIEEWEIFSYAPYNGQAVLVPYTLVPTLTESEFPTPFVDYITGRPLDAEAEVAGEAFAEGIGQKLQGSSALQAEIAAEYHGGQHIVAVSRAMLRQMAQADNVAVTGVNLAMCILLLLVAALNIVHLVIAAVQGNRQTIALKMAVGASVGAVGKELFRELLVINLKGGYIGIALAGICIALLNDVTKLYVFSFDILSLLLGLVAVLLLSFVSLLPPLASLARLQPAQAIREGRA